MTLQEYLEKKYPDLSIGLASTAFAKEVNSSRQVIERYRLFERYPVPEMIVKIENATKGLVAAADHLPPKLASQRVNALRTKKVAGRNR